jgi:FkbM family methyltransferase
MSLTSPVAQPRTQGQGNALPQDFGSRLGRAKMAYAGYAGTFGIARGTALFAASQARPKPSGRRVTAMLPGTGIPVTLRLGSSDMNVFWEIFRRLEYGWNFSAPPRVIVDVGGYTGLSAAYFAHRYPEATIIAVEPDAENFELLTLNTARFPGVRPVQAAVWRESGTISLHDPGYGAWGLQVTEPDNAAPAPAAGDAGPAAGLIRAVTIDEIITEYGLDRIDLLKIDVEGSEKEVFATAGSWLPFVDAICIELHDRFKTGCSRSFFRAVDEFPIELRRNEDVLVARADSRLAPIYHS